MGVIAEFKKLGSAFALLWVGQTAAGFGGGLLQFAMGIWVYQRSGSAQQFAIAFLCGTVPALLLMPWAGTLADHFDRRWVIIGTDVGGALLSLLLAGLLLSDLLTVPHLYVFAAVGSVLGSLRGPSFQAAVSAVLPVHSMTRASGLSGLSQGILQLVTPVVAAALMASSGLRAIVAIQLVTLLFGAFAVFRAFSLVKNAFGSARSGARPAFLKGFVGGLSPGLAFFRKEPLMGRLFIYVVIYDGLLVLVSTMFTPLVLSTHSSATLALVTSSGAAGALAGSMLLVVVNTQRRLMVWSLAFNLCLSLCVVTAGFYTSTAVWCACAFLALLAGSASDGYSLALWMRKTPETSRGSIFSLLGVSQLAAASLVMLVGGVVGEHVLEPALAVGGAWQDGIGRWFGTGHGRGMGFLFVLCGSACALVSLIALMRSGLRRLDELVSDPPRVAADT